MRERLRLYLAGAVSLFDLSGILAFRAARAALPPADDMGTAGDCFSVAARDLRAAASGKKVSGA